MSLIPEGEEVLRFLLLHWLLVAHITSLAQAPEIEGNIDGVQGTDQNSLAIIGWACQVGVPQSISVQLYVGNVFEQGGISVVGATANLNNGVDDGAIVQTCRTGTAPRRFRIPITQEILKTHGGKPIFVYGISVVQGFGNDTIENSGRIYIPTPTIIGNIDGIARAADGSLTLAGWACQRYIAQPLEVMLYAGGVYREGGTSVVGALANAASDATIDQACSTSGVARRFHIPLTADTRRLYAGKSMHVYGISAVPSNFNMTIAGSGQYYVPMAGLLGFNYFPASGADPAGCYGHPHATQPRWEAVKIEVTADLHLMKSLGVSTVRLPVIPSKGNGFSRASAEPGEIPKYCNHLVDMLHLYKQNDMKIIVDLHNFYLNPHKPGADDPPWWFLAYEDPETYKRLVKRDLKAFCAAQDGVSLSPFGTDYPRHSSLRQFAATQYGVTEAGLAGADCSHLASDEWTSDSTMTAIANDPGFLEDQIRRINKWRFFLGESSSWVDKIVDIIQNSSAADTVLYYDLLNEYYAPDVWNLLTGFDYPSSVRATTDTYIQHIHGLLRRRGVPENRIGVSVVGEPDESGTQGVVNIEAAVAATKGINPLSSLPIQLGYFDVHYYPETRNGLRGMSVDLAAIQSYVKSHLPGATMVIGEFGRETTIPPDSYWSDEKQEAMVLRTLLDAMNRTPGLGPFLNWGLWRTESIIMQSSSFAFGDSPHKPKDVLAYVAGLSNLIPNGDAEIVTDGVPAGWRADGDVAVSFTSGSTTATPASPAATHARFAHAAPLAPCKTGCWMRITSPRAEVRGASRLYLNAFVRSDLVNITFKVVQYDAAGGRLPQIQLPSKQFTPSDGAEWNSFLARVGGWYVDLSPQTRTIELLIAGEGKDDGSSSFLDVDTLTSAAVVLNP